jgi:endonuclease/exonuclease/phosphatase (EEP) superfamily protein YafD
VASGLVAAALTGGTAAAPAATPTAAASATPVEARIGSYNIRADVSAGGFARAVSALTPLVDAAGLQEVNSHDKEAVLASLASSGWSYYRAKPGEQNPVIWDSRRFTFLSARNVRIAARTYIGHEVSAARLWQNDLYATVVRLRDLQTDALVTLINTHLAPGAVINGAAYPGRPRLFREYTTSVANLLSLVRAERADGTVFVLGDLNVGWVQDARKHLLRLPYASFRRNLMGSMWATERPASRGSHVGSPALIDQVYAAQKALHASVKFAVTYSDHYPVVATYLLAPPSP